MGHSGGGHLVTWYQNVAEHGPAACQGPEKIYPCDGARLTGLAKPDGIIMLDSTLGAFHQMSAVDPAVDGDKRNASLDMFTAANGYDTAAKRAKYSADFAKRFYAAQSARNATIVDNAVARLNAHQAGQGTVQRRRTAGHSRHGRECGRRAALSAGPLLRRAHKETAYAAEG